MRSDRIVGKTTARGPLATQTPWFESTTKFGSFHGNLGPFHGNSGPFTQIWVLFTLIHGNSRSYRSFCVDWFQWFYRKSGRMCFIRYAPSSRISEIPHPTKLGSLDEIWGLSKGRKFWGLWRLGYIYDILLYTLIFNAVFKPDVGMFTYELWEHIISLRIEHILHLAALQNAAVKPHKPWWLFHRQSGWCQAPSKQIKVYLSTTPKLESTFLFFATTTCKKWFSENRTSSKLRGFGRGHCLIFWGKYVTSRFEKAQFMLSKFRIWKLTTD